jgi:hypothetical protein
MGIRIGHVVLVTAPEVAAGLVPASELSERVIVRAKRPGGLLLVEDEDGVRWWTGRESVASVEGYSRD